MQTSKYLILVVGVSGVGKTTICKTLASQCSMVEALSASSFITNNNDIDQKVLASQIKEYVEKTDALVVLLDGHLVLENRKVELDTIKILPLDSIFFVYDDVERIIDNIYSDSFRSRDKLSLDEIERLQNLELQAAIEYATSLSVEFNSIRPRESRLLRDYIAKKCATSVES